jgi:hypothetical protein
VRARARVCKTHHALYANKHTPAVSAIQAMQNVVLRIARLWAEAFAGTLFIFYI